MVFLVLAAATFGAAGVLMLSVDPPYGYVLSVLAFWLSLHAFARTDFSIDSQYLSATRGWLFLGPFRRQVHLSEIRELRLERRNISSRKHSNYHLRVVLNVSPFKEILLDHGIPHVRRLAPLREVLRSKGVRVVRWRDDE